MQSREMIGNKTDIEVVRWKFMEGAHFLNVLMDYVINRHRWSALN